MLGKLRQLKISKRTKVRKLKNLLAQKHLEIMKHGQQTVRKES